MLKDKLIRNNFLNFFKDYNYKNLMKEMKNMNNWN